MNIINLSVEMLDSFDLDSFNIEKWKSYMDASIPGVKELCLKEMQETIDAGFSWESDFLPVLNNVIQDDNKRNKTIESFCNVTAHLDERIISVFKKTVNVDLILYLGLCNGAGWVTTLNNKPIVLFGIEKIMELDWCDKDSMFGLVVHELGHVYQNQYGVLHRRFKSDKDNFLWQLFTEGIAMVFEQGIVSNPEYFHQDKNGWKKWCDEHVELIKESFKSDLNSMTEDNQRYFGDWVSFYGYGDTGYYLGALFVRYLLKSNSFDEIIVYDIQEVKDAFERFLCS